MPHYRVDCWRCVEGFLEDEGCTCGEDCCCCLEPEPPVCDVCRGKGYLVVSELTEDNCDNAVQITGYAPMPLPTEGKPGPHYGTFTELREGGRFCTCCEKELSGHAFRWLELDQRDWTYHDRGDVPADKSQGWFPFGLTCAKKKLKEAAAKAAA